MSDWISVDDRLPKEKQDVLAYRGRIQDCVTVTSLGEDWMYVTGEWVPEGWITHWMPLPEPPKYIGGWDE